MSKCVWYYSCYSYGVWLSLSQAFLTKLLPILHWRLCESGLKLMLIRCPYLHD